MMLTVLGKLFNFADLTSNFYESTLMCYTTTSCFETGTFEDSASRLFNSLPNSIKLETNAKTFAREVFKFLKIL